MNLSTLLMFEKIAAKHQHVGSGAFKTRMGGVRERVNVKDFAGRMKTHAVKAPFTLSRAGKVGLGLAAGGATMLAVIKHRADKRDREERINNFRNSIMK